MKYTKTNSLFLLSLLITGLFANISVSFAEYTQDQVCKYVNYQYASVEKSEKKEEDKAAFKSEMVTIAEERLGSPDEKTTFNCFRVIDCSMKTVETGTKETPKSEQLRKCVTKYESTCSGGIEDKELIKAYQTPTQEYKICEPVMIYLSSPGNDLLYYYMGQIYTYAATMGALLAVLILIIAGIMYTTAGDNTNQTTLAKGLIIKCISGLVVLFLTALILYIINPNFFTI